MALSGKREAFVREYLVDLNATAAYRRAGYKPKSDEAAKSAASRLLTFVDVREAVEKALAVRASRTLVTQDWVIEQLKKQALRDDERASHGAIVSALKLLGQHVGMWTDAEVQAELARLRKEFDDLRRSAPGAGPPGGGPAAAPGSL